MSRELLVVGAGYIGAELVVQAQKNGWNVTGVTKSGSACFLGADVSSLDSVEKLHREIKSPDVIVHCPSSGRGGAEAYEAVFYKGVSHLLTVFPTVPILFVSSTSVYAQLSGEVVTEKSATVPTRETGKILLKTEDLVLRNGGITARLAGIYGPNRSVLLKKLLTEKAVIEEDGRRIINQIHRDDAASALLFLANRLMKNESAGECFNVSDSFPRSQKETYNTLCKHFNFPEPSIGSIDHNRKRGWTHKAVSNDKLKALGWTLHYPDFLQAAPLVLETLS